MHLISGFIDFIKECASVFNTYKDLFISGAIKTLMLSVITVGLGTILGGVFAILRQKKIPVFNQILTFIIDFVRGTPLLTQLFIFAQGFWSLVYNTTGIRTSDYMWCVLALVLNSACYISEIFRAGIQAVDKGQTEAALSLGMSKSHTMNKIILPQAIKNIIPALGNEFVTIIKETSLVSMFFIGELMTTYNTIKAATYIILPTLMVVSVIYYIFTTSISFGLKKLEERLSVSD